MAQEVYNFAEQGMRLLQDTDGSYFIQNAKNKTKPVELKIELDDAPDMSIRIALLVDKNQLGYDQLADRVVFYEKTEAVPSQSGVSAVPTQHIASTVEMMKLALEQNKVFEMTSTGPRFERVNGEMIEVQPATHLMTTKKTELVRLERVKESETRLAIEQSAADLWIKDRQSESDLRMNGMKMKTAQELENLKIETENRLAEFQLEEKQILGEIDGSFKKMKIEGETNRKLAIAAVDFEITDGEDRVRRYKLSSEKEVKKLMEANRAEEAKRDLDYQIESYKQAREAKKREQEAELKYQEEMKAMKLQELKKKEENDRKMAADKQELNADSKKASVSEQAKFFAREIDEEQKHWDERLARANHKAAEVKKIQELTASTDEKIKNAALEYQLRMQEMRYRNEKNKVDAEIESKMKEQEARQDYEEAHKNSYCSIQ